MVPGPRPPPGPKPPPGSPAIKPQSTALQAIQLQTTSFSTPSGGAVSSYTARPSITVLGKRGEKLATTTARNLANIVWAFAKMEYDPGQQLLQEVADELATKAASCNPQNVANSEATKKLNKFNAQNIANLIWAFASLAQSGDKSTFIDLFDGAAAAAEKQMGSFSPQNAANTIWAFAKLEHPVPSLMKAVAGHAEWSIKEYQPQSVANLVWALATLQGEPGAGLLQSVAAHFKSNLKEYSPQNLANTVWALATIKYTNKELSNSVWALARLGHYDADFMEIVAGEAESRISEFSQQNLANTAWAFSKISHFRQSLLDAIADQAVAIFEMTEDRLFSMDISLAREKVCIEVDGPHHFSANTLRPSGENLARQRLLRARGWAVVSIPFFKWSDKDDDDHVKLLQSVSASPAAMTILSYLNPSGGSDKSQLYLQTCSMLMLRDLCPGSGPEPFPNHTQDA
ncbi:hypothetical protein WJX84_005546 [Apatococcus fuscideae]|uniref:RAP domain-containing protein n=1 Tax=Apatococcus fuscideae TaxID=2026836 RepID=A0AAW1T3P4_9CHLO